MAKRNIGTAYVQIVPTTDGITGAVQRQLNNSASAAGLTMGKLIGGNLISSGIMAIGQHMGGLISGIRETNTAWTSFTNNMAMSGMAASGIEEVKTDLQTFAKQTIYTSKDMAQTYAQLYAVNQDTTTALVKGFGAVAAAAQNPQQAMITMSTQATQMAAKPTVAWMDFKLMLEQTPAGISQVAKVMGVSTKDLVANVQAGKVKTEDFFAAIESLGSDANGTLMQMATSYKTSGQAAEGLEATLQTKLAPAFQIFDQLGIQAIGSVTSKVVDFFNLAAPIFEGVGQHIVDVAERLFTLGDELGSAGGKVGEFGSKIATLGLEALKAIVEGVANAINKFCDIVVKANNFIAEHKTLLQNLGIVIGVLTGIYIALNAVTIAHSIASAAETVALVAMYAAESVASVGASVLTAAMTLLQAPFAPVIIVIGLLIGAFILLWKNSETFREGVKKLASTVKSAFNAIVQRGKNLVQTISENFKTLKSKLTKPFETARDIIKKIVDKIKGFFPLKVGKIFSNLKIPHINISGGKAPFGIGGAGTKPSISVSWYKKAMGNPYLFSNATLFGAGEAGDEMLYGRNSLMNDIRSAVESSKGGNTFNITLTANGTESPEEYAQRFARELRRQVRMGAI